jgi:GNAT superfamily N-acetyltransferase
MERRGRLPRALSLDRCRRIGATSRIESSLADWSFTMSNAEISVVTPAPDEINYLEDRIYEFNSTTTGITGGAWLALFVRDETGRIVAGISGDTWGGCLEIRQLWVEESRRSEGLATRLLEAAEQEGRRRGCAQVVLMTFSFQAPGFYMKRGFEVVAALDDHPRGHRNLLLRKLLRASY